MAIFQLPVRFSSQVIVLDTPLAPSQWIMCVRMHAVQSRTGPSYVMLDREAELQPSRAKSEAQEQFILYAVPGSVGPTNSLLDKFRRLCHRSEVSYSCPAGYPGKPKSLAS